MKKSTKWRLFIGMPLIFAALSVAHAATLKMPSVTITGDPSTTITCSAPPSNLVAPVAPGTVMSTCTVEPSTWSGAVSLSTGPQFAITGLNGSKFNVAVGATALVAGTYPLGTVQTAP